MTGGYISLSGNKKISINEVLRFILTDFKLKYNAYIIRKNNKLIYNIDIFIKNEQRLLMFLTDELIELEQRIKTKLTKDAKK